MERIRQPAVADDERCGEPGCDRVSAPSDGRCTLHASRLGPLPREALARAPSSSEPLEVRPTDAAREAAQRPQGVSAWEVASVVAAVLMGAAWTLLLSDVRGGSLRLVALGLVATGLFPTGLAFFRASGTRQVLLSFLLVTVSLATLLVALYLTMSVGLRPGLFANSAEMLGGAKTKLLPHPSKSATAPARGRPSR